MLNRFEGDNGARYLVEAIKPNRLVQHNDILAQRLAKEAELVEFLATQKLMEQGDDDRTLYLILTGEVGIYVNGRLVAVRGPGEPIGEMALIDAMATRSATVTARVTTVALKVTEPLFFTIAADFPQIYKPIAEIIGERLRERARFHRPPNPQPVLFIGSSVEGLDIANHIHLGLKHDPITVVIWNQGIFGPSSITLDILDKMAKESDFAAFVFGPDDKIISRDEKYAAPRDNVVFELGQFLNELRRDRVFIIKQHGSEIKIPSDLLGITPVTYKIQDVHKIDASIGPVCTEIREAIRLQGPR